VSAVSRLAAPAGGALDGAAMAPAAAAADLAAIHLLATLAAQQLAQEMVP